MKKITLNILIAFLLIFPYSVRAEGYISVTPNTLTIEKGSSKTFTISAYNAIGDVTIKSNDNNIVKVSSDEWSTGMVEEKQTKTGTITVNAVNIGTTNIVLNIDAATFDYDDLSNQVKTITVKVVPKTTTTKPTVTTKPTTTKPITTKPIEGNSLSKNNKIKSIKIDGYNLVEIDKNNYTLEVGYGVEKLSINVIAEDEKAKVIGNGEHKIEIGENNIELSIISESGAENTIKVKITRKSSYYLEELKKLLEDKNEKDINITINPDTIVTKEIVNLIKTSKKLVNLNCYNEAEKLVYSWILDGKNIKKTADIITTINYSDKTTKEIEKLSNYADGLYLNFKQEENFPTGIKVKVYLKDKYENSNELNIYQYNANKNNLKLISRKVKIIDGYIEFELKDSNKYFITLANLNLVGENNTVNTFMSIFLVEFTLILILLLLYIKKLKKRLKDEIEITKQISNNS